MVREETKPPFAVMAFTKDSPIRTVLYPFAEYSPEYQAIVWAKEHGAQCRFMDLPSDGFLGIRRAGEGQASPEHTSGSASEHVYRLLDRFDGEDGHGDTCAGSIYEKKAGGRTEGGIPGRTNRGSDRCLSCGGTGRRGACHDRCADGIAAFCALQCDADALFLLPFVHTLRLWGGQSGACLLRDAVAGTAGGRQRHGNLPLPYSHIRLSEAAWFSGILCRGH